MRRLSVLGVVVLLAISGCGSESEVGLRVETQDAIWGCVLNITSPDIEASRPQYSLLSDLQRQCRSSFLLFTSDFTRMGEPTELMDLGSAILETASDPSASNRQKLSVLLKVFAGTK